MTELWDDGMNTERKNINEDSNHRIIKLCNLFLID
jgi:hypothetical protein